MCILPEDLKNFFLTTNGLLIQWSIKFDGNEFHVIIVSYSFWYILTCIASQFSGVGIWFDLGGYMLLWFPNFAFLDFLRLKWNPILEIDQLLIPHSIK